jgi:hypothetical protein
MNIPNSIDDDTLRELLRNSESADELGQLIDYLPQHRDLILDLLIKRPGMARRSEAA